MRHIIFILTLTSLLLSCGQTDTKQKELELKERELALKEKEFAFKEKDTSNFKTVRPDTVKIIASLNDGKIQEVKSQNQSNISSNVNCKVILKNLIPDENGSKRGDIYFNINSIDYLAQKDEWIRDWKEFQNKGNRLAGCSIGEKGTMDGYTEYWIEKSGNYLLLKTSYVGGNAQIGATELIKKIKL